MPNQPTAKNELNTNSKTADTIWVAELSMLPRMARSTIVSVWPTEPNSMSGRRPTRSMRKMATRLARKYSVPLQAAIIRESTSPRPRRSKSSVYEKH